MRCATSVILLFFFSQLSVASGSNKSDLDQLQGTWKEVSAQYNGVDLPAEKLAGHVVTLVIKGDVLTETTVGQEDQPSRATIRLDPAKSPKEIDTTDKEPDPGQQAKVFLGIYKIEGDTFTECFGRAGVSRPTKFKSTDRTTMVRVFKRANP